MAEVGNPEFLRVMHQDIGANNPIPSPLGHLPPALTLAVSVSSPPMPGPAMINPQVSAPWNPLLNAFRRGDTMLRGVQLPGANLRSTQIPFMTLVDANLQDADLTEAFMPGVSLIRTRLTRATLVRVNLIGADLLRSDLHRANLYRSLVSGAFMVGVNLSWANLREATLSGSKLCGANLRGSDLRGVNLQGADLRGADLRGANLRGAMLEGCNLLYTRMPDGTYRDYDEIPFNALPAPGQDNRLTALHDAGDDLLNGVCGLGIRSREPATADGAGDQVDQQPQGTREQAEG